MDSLLFALFGTLAAFTVVGDESGPGSQRNTLLFVFLEKTGISGRFRDPIHGKTSN